MTAPTRDTPALEFKLGSCDRSTAAHVKIRYHSTVVGDSTVQVGPHTVEKNIFDVEPPMMIKATHVPPDRYMIGNATSQFASFGPIHVEMVHN